MFYLFSFRPSVLLLLTIATSKRHRSEHFHFFLSFPLNTTRNFPKALYCPINPAGVGRPPRPILVSNLCVPDMPVDRLALSIPPMYQFSMESRGKFVKGWCFNNGRAFLRLHLLLLLLHPNSSVYCTNCAIQLALDQIRGTIFKWLMRSDATQFQEGICWGKNEIGNCLSIKRTDFPSYLFLLVKIKMTRCRKNIVNDRKS